MAGTEGKDKLARLRELSLRRVSISRIYLLDVCQ